MSKLKPKGPGVSDSKLTEAEARKKARKGNKDMKLLSFGEEAEEEEKDLIKAQVRMHSSHDSKLKDSRLSSEV